MSNDTTTTATVAEDDTVRQCEVSRIGTHQMGECTNRAIGNVVMSYPDGISMTVHLCLECVKVLQQSIKNYDERMGGA